MISAKVEALDRDVAVIFAEALSPQARSGMLAQFALEQLAETQDAYRSQFGASPESESFVDGSRSDDFTRVRPDGTIVIEFGLFAAIAQWILDQLRQHSPVLTGRYQRSHRVFVDNVEIDDPNAIPIDADQVVFAPIVEYARKIEQGWSKKAPDGVYQAVAEIARSRFGRVAKIAFGYQEVIGLQETKREKSRGHSGRDLRQPAIFLTAK